MQGVIDETYWSRKLQVDYNEDHGITPVGIHKAIKDITDRVRAVAESRPTSSANAPIPRDEALRLIRHLEGELKDAAKKLEFERAALLRDQIGELRRTLE